MLMTFSCLLMLLLYRLHSSIYAGERLCYIYRNCTQQNTTAQVSTTVVAVIASVLGVILLVLLIVCTVALVVCLKRKQGRMKREIIGNLYNSIRNSFCLWLLFVVTNWCWQELENREQGWKTWCLLYKDRQKLRLDVFLGCGVILWTKSF